MLQPGMDFVADTWWRNTLAEHTHPSETGKRGRPWVIVCSAPGVGGCNGVTAVGLPGRLYGSTREKQRKRGFGTAMAAAVNAHSDLVLTGKAYR